jgi:hypothetical protein
VGGIWRTLGSFIERLRSIASMLRIVRYLAVLALLAACTTDDSAAIKGRWVTIPDTALSLEVPDGVTVIGRREPPSDTIFEFSSGSQLILKLYVGTAPSFHPGEHDAGIESETVGGRSARTRVVESAAGWSRDMLVEAPEHRFYHFSYRDLRPPALLLADHIIGSLRDGVAAQ